MRVRHQVVSVLWAVSILCTALFCFASAAVLWAQSTNSGVVTGTVTDPSNAVVNGATVTLTDTSTKASRTITTNDAGRYIFVDVEPGAYDVSISKQGFSTIKT